MQLVALPLGLSGFAAGILLAQWAAFVPSFLARTEHFYDLTGSLTYIGAMVASRALSPARDGRQLVASLFVMAWALRLGLFLFTRVLRVGKDSRFDGVKERPLAFLLFWTVQALWVFLCSLPVLVCNQKQAGEERVAWPGPTDAAGILLYVAGLATEASMQTADSASISLQGDGASDSPPPCIPNRWWRTCRRTPSSTTAGTGASGSTWASGGEERGVIGQVLVSKPN